MAAIVLSLVYRQVRYLSDILRLLEQEGLLWVEAMSVSKQALSQRLVSLPAHLFIAMFNQVAEQIRATPMGARARIQAGGTATVCSRVDCRWLDARAIAATPGTVARPTEKSAIAAS